MSLFRNREIKQFSLWMLIFCALAVAAGFVMNVLTGFFIAVVCVLLCVAFFLFMKNRYRNIAFLCEQIDLVLHGNDALDIEIYSEGELSILQSEIHKMTVRLREHSDTLKKEKVYLSDGIADIAHQVRTPMTSIRMVVNFLGKSELSETRRLELVRELEGLLSRIDWLIASLLKISKIDAGTAVFKHESVYLPALIGKAVEPLVIPLELRDIALRVDGKPEVHFKGDLNWTAEAIGNIVKNCMEHTPRGGVIDIAYIQNAVYTEIVIKDNGSGIDKEDLPHIFERFYQGKNPKEGSFGVGLALCRMILSRQNATVKAANQAGGGACFCVRFYHHAM